MCMHSGDGDMERGQFIKGLESAIQQAAQRMDEAQQHKDLMRFSIAADAWKQASGLWLQAAQGMTWEKAQAVMIGFATGGYAKTPKIDANPPIIRHELKTYLDLLHRHITSLLLMYSTLLAFCDTKNHGKIGPPADPHGASLDPFSHPARRK